MTSPIDAQEALARLRAGNQRYIDGAPIAGVSPAQRMALAQGQQPYAAILCCTDSRVAPEILFNASLGDLFVVRIAGNSATTEAIASLEFAVTQLQTKLVVVLGHEHCGAVNAAIAQLQAQLQAPPQQASVLSDTLSALIGHIAPSVSAVGTNDSAAVTKTHSQLSAAIVKRCQAIDVATDVQVIWGYQALASGEVLFEE